MMSRSEIGTMGLVIAGFSLGAAMTAGLRAQTKPPAYVVIDISETMDVQAYIKAVSTSEPNVTTSAGGRFLVRSSAPVGLDGPAAPNRFVIIAFDSVDKAKAWHTLPAIAEINAVRSKTTKSRAFIVEGAN